MIGPGKYDDFTTLVREQTDARGVILLVFGGKLGNGFSCQLPIELTSEVPTVLRTLANHIEADETALLQQQKNN